MTRRSAFVAFSFALFYLTLSVAALACPADLGTTSHHHSPTHSPLCTWVCQAITSPALTSSALLHTAQWTLLYVVALIALPTTVFAYHFSLSRGPPR